MIVFPVVFDSRPAFMSGGPAEASILLAPAGRVLVIQLIEHALLSGGLHGVTIVPRFQAGSEYEAAVRRECPSLKAIVPCERIESYLLDYEPSDWLLLIDPTCLPANGLEPADVLTEVRSIPPVARHLVPLARSAAGTREILDIDPAGSLRRIQRYYDEVTWTVASGVAASLVPVASLKRVGAAAFSSLPRLRTALASSGAPSMDVPVPGGRLDLSRESGLLRLNERILLGQFRNGGAAHTSGAEAAVAGEIATGARLVGPVVVHAGAVVQSWATVAGPSVIGPDVRIGTGAVVAQSVIGRGVTVPDETVVRHRALFHANGAQPAAPPDGQLDAGPPLEEDLVWADDLVDVRDERPHRWFSPRFKVVFDWLVGAALLVLLSPLLLIVAALVKATSKGPVLYGDEREGKGGRVFRCYKFRTMREGAAALQRELYADNVVDGPQFKLKHDPRITPVGKVLRVTNIDELPQLLNVLLGQMSLVGPRPSPFRENQLCVPWREARLSVRPGITGLWQVCRHDRTEADFHQWIHYDMLYVRHLSLAVDLRVVIATVFTLITGQPVPLRWIIPTRHLHALH